MYTAAQFSNLIANIEGLTIEEAYDFRYDIECPVELAPDVEDVVYILKRE